MIHNRIESFPFLGKVSEAQEEQSLDAFEAVRPALTRVGNTIANTIRKQPLAGIAVGLAVGVALGCLIKRR